MSKIERVQARLLEMTIGGTSVVFGRVVTRWAKDVWELDTYAQDRSLQGSEHTAEAIVCK